GSSGQSVPSQPSGGGPSRPGAAFRRLTAVPLIVPPRSEQRVNIHGSDGTLDSSPQPPLAAAPVISAVGPQAKRSAAEQDAADAKRELPAPLDEPFPKP